MKDLAFLFPGGGSHYVGMGKILCARHEKALATFNEANDILGYDLKSIVFNGDIKTLSSMKYSQPAIYTMGVAAFRVLTELFGFLPGSMAGHSLGEYTALTCAGAMTFEHGMKLVCRRADLLGKIGAENSVTMMAVNKIEARVVEVECEHMNANGARLYVAVYNSPQQCVVSGVRNDLNKLAIALQSRGGETAMLDIPTASHSPFMSPVTGEFLAYLQEFKFRTPVSEVISNITGLPFVVDSIVETLTAHLDHPVRWHQSIIHLKERGFKFFLDMGPQQILKNLCRRIDNSLVSYGFDCIDDSENVKTLGEQGNPAIRLLKKCLVFSVSAKNHNYDVHRYATDVLAPIADLRSIRNGLTTVCNVSGCETAVSLTRKILHGKGYSEQEVNSMTRDLETEIDAIRATR